MNNCDDVSENLESKERDINAFPHQEPKISRLQKKLDLMIATPGRMFDLISQGHLRVNRVEILVLDEATSALDDATEKLLENKKGPSRKAGELDNRGSHFYLAMYWAQELANQSDDEELKSKFTDIANNMSEKETHLPKKNTGKTLCT